MRLEAPRVYQTIRGQQKPVDGKFVLLAKQQVGVEIEGSSYTLGIDPISGRILSLSYRRRGPGGDFGQLTKVYSDFRSVNGMTLPFKITATFNAQLWKEQSATIESISINGKVDPALFEKPKTARSQ